MSTPSNAPRRFPRVHGGAVSAAFALLLRSNPSFKVSVPKDKMSVVFSYKFSVPDELPPEFRELYGPFFNGGRKDWKKFLEEAVQQAVKGEKRSLGRVYNFHRSVLTKGFQNWVSDMWGVNADLLPRRNEELEKFKKDSLLRTGTKIDAVIAFMAAIRFRQVDEILKDLLHSLKAKPEQVANKELRIEKAIERTKLSQELIMRGLVNIYGEGSDITLLLERRVRHESIARAMVCCELEDRGCNLSSISGRTYINYGDRILAILDAYNKGH